MQLPRVASKRRLLGGSSSTSGMNRWLSFLLLGATCFLGYLYMTPDSGLLQWGASPATRIDTLVVYVFRNTDPESLNNLNFFLQQGIRQGDGASYLIAIEPLGDSDSMTLPELPSNARFVRPEKKCLENGIVGWVLFESGLVNLHSYRYFVWLNSSVRGPYLPAYMDVNVAWHQLLTSRITNTVKLVGATISCDGLRVNPEHGLVQFPHVQAYLQATDMVGLSKLREGTVFGCHTLFLEYLRFGEIGASETMLNAGYGLDCLMLRYQGVDWQDRTKWGCGSRMNPIGEGLYDGVDINPLEVMFIRVQQAGVVTDVPNVKLGLKYSEWAKADVGRGAPDVTTNEWSAVAASRLKVLKEKGGKCFDADYYVNSAPVEFRGFTAAQAYDHFINFGHKEGRLYQYLC